MPLGQFFGDSRNVLAGLSMALQGSSSFAKTVLTTQPVAKYPLGTNRVYCGTSSTTLLVLAYGDRFGSVLKNCLPLLDSLLIL